VALSVGVEQLGREADHSSPSRAEVRECGYTSTPQYALMAWCSVKSTGRTLPLPSHHLSYA